MEMHRGPPGIRHCPPVKAPQGYKLDCIDPLTTDKQPELHYLSYLVEGQSRPIR